MGLIYALSLYILVQTLVWFSVNYQFMNSVSNTRALIVCVILAIPTSLTGYYASKAGFAYFESVWSSRLVAFGTSFIVFPALTWFLLRESPFNIKTMSCILLSFIIIAIQIFYHE